jgi:peptidoglycan hydrolase CwlO-like protein
VAHDVIFRLRPRNLTRDPWDLTTGRSVIGRGPGCTLHLNEDGIADQHCLLLAGPRRLVVKALSPFTWLNDGTFREAVCTPGDRLTIGPIEFIIEALPLPHPQPVQGEPVLPKRAIPNGATTTLVTETELQEQRSAAKASRSWPTTFDELTSLLDQYFAHRDSSTDDGSVKQQHSLSAPVSIGSALASVANGAGLDSPRPEADFDAIRVRERELDQLATRLAEQAASHRTRERELAERSRELAEQVRELELLREQQDQQQQLLRARQEQLDARDARLSERERDCQRLADDLQQLQSQQNTRAGELQQLWQQLSEREHALQQESEAGAIQARATAQQLEEIRKLQLALSADRERLEVEQRELSSQQQSLSEHQARLHQELVAIEAEQAELTDLRRELTGRATELDIQEATLTERLHDLQQRESLLLASRNQLTAAREAWTLEQQLQQQELAEQRLLNTAQQEQLAALEAELKVRAGAVSPSSAGPVSALLSTIEAGTAREFDKSPVENSLTDHSEVTQLQAQVEQLQEELAAIQVHWEESRAALEERIQERDGLLQEREHLWEQLQRAADSSPGTALEQEPAAPDAELPGLLQQREVELQQREAELQQLQELCSALELRLEQYASRGDRAEQELRRREVELRNWEAQLIEREAELNEIWQELQTSATEPHLDHEAADLADNFGSEFPSRRSFTHADSPEITKLTTNDSDPAVGDESLPWESEIEQRLRVADPDADFTDGDYGDGENDYWSAAETEQTVGEEYPTPDSLEHNSLRLQLAEMFGLPAESLRQLQSVEETSESLQPFEEEDPEADRFYEAQGESPETEPAPEDPIAAYMERLLARSRRQEEAPVPETISLDTGKPKPAGAAIAVLPPAEEKSLLNPLPAERATPQPLESKPRKLGVEERDALRANLDSFRELANLSARSAVARSQSNRLQGTIQIHQYLTVAAWIATGTLLSSTLWMNSSYLIPGVLALAGALALSWRTLMLWLELKKQENIPMASFEGIEPAAGDDAG